MEKIKINIFSKLFFGIAILIICYSCSKEGTDNFNVEEKPDTSNINVTDTATIPKFDLSKLFLIEDLETDSSYFNKDSLKLYDISDGLCNNLGIGYNSYSNRYLSPIFRAKVSIKPLVSIELNEKFSKLIVASWCKSTINEQLGKVLIEKFNCDSSDLNLNTYKNDYDSTYIFVNIFLRKQFANVKLNYTNPQINNYLIYKTSLFGEFAKDSILVKPDNFYLGHGNKFQSEFKLGTFLNIEGFIVLRNIHFNRPDSIIKKITNIISKLINDSNLRWNELTQNDKYLQNSNFIIDYIYSIPGTHFGFNPNILLSEIETSYKNMHFSVLNSKFTEYSKLYPTYNFQN